MQSKSVAHYCQKCLAANPFGQELCERCGTRLMLVVEPPAIRFDEVALNIAQEDHLLERVSVLENRLLRMTEKLERTLDLVLRHARNTYFDHALIETLIGVLEETGTIEAKKVDGLWRKRCEKDSAGKEDE